MTKLEGIAFVLAKAIVDANPEHPPETDRSHRHVTSHPFNDINLLASALGGRR